MTDANDAKTSGDNDLLLHKKVAWACRRGMLELDIFLQRFFAEAYDDLSKAEQENFRKLLQYPDPDLFSWLMGYEVCAVTELQQLCAKIRAHVQGT